MPSMGIGGWLEYISPLVNLGIYPLNISIIKLKIKNAMKVYFKQIYKVIGYVNF